jgi:putative ABC transport system permease protein
MSFLDVVLKNLVGRTNRTLLTIAGLSVAVTAITTMWTVTWGYATSSENFYATRGVDIVVVRAGVSNRLTSNLHTDVVDRIRQLPNVERVDGSLTEMVSLGENHLLGIPLRGYLPESAVLSELSLQAGQAIKGHETGRVLLGAGLADALGKQPGQPIEIEGTRFEIAGVFQGENPFDTNSLIGSLADVERLMGRPGIVSEIQVRAVPAARSEASLLQVCHDIESLQNEDHESLGLKAQRTKRFVTSASEAKLSGAMAIATMAIVITLSFIGMLNAMLMSVLERTREIAVLRAVGWKRSRVVRMILGEGFVLGLAGALVGNLAAVLVMMGLRRWSLTSFLVPSEVSLKAMGLAIVTVFVAALAGSFYPSFHAASVTPVEALRHE